MNGHFYYGVHRLVDKRDDYLGSGKVLLNAISKYGKENFKREIVSTHNTATEAYAVEASIVNNELVKNQECYNIKEGGFGGCLGHTEQTKQKIKDALVKRGGHKGKNNPCYGRHLSEEQKKKLSASRKGIKFSDEQRKNVSAGLMGKKKPPFSDEHRRKIGESKRGIVLSAEVRKKMSDSTREYWRRKKKEIEHAV